MRTRQTYLPKKYHQAVERWRETFIPDYDMRVGAHLVQVGVHLRVPLQVGSDSCFGFRLSSSGPVAVHIKHVMIDSSAWPNFIVLGRNRIGIWKSPCRLTKIIDKSITAIGILLRIKDDQ